MMIMRLYRLACATAVSAVLLLFLGTIPAGAADDDLESLEQKALAAAAERVAPSVVRIETVGGLERVEEVLFGTGPTTGLVIDPQGYIVSSAFNFVNKPASILVRAPDGTRKPAKLVATDHNRMIVLLKIEMDRPLTVPEAAPESEMRVGQWCVAVGRTFESEGPNIAVGILSALGRIWGKAIQTDAALSPNNYGGPLVDIRGRVLGVIVPLSPQSAGEVAGVEWYDSGIGFAIPLEQIKKNLARLKKGEDLYSGVAGFNLQAKDLSTGDTAIASCRPNSPAAKAGFKAGDRIVEIDGQKIARAAEIKQEISRRYAGERLSITVLRGDKPIRGDVELVAKLDPYQNPFLGILPMRATGGKRGVAVRYVYPKGPAADAKIEPGDVLLSLGGKAVKDRDAWLQQMATFEPGQEAEIEVRHGDQTRKAKIKFAALPEALPPERLPPAHPPVKPGGQGPKTGVISLQVPEFKNQVWAYVPDSYARSVPHGVVVWLQGSVVAEQKDLLARWKPLCDRHDLVLVVPKAAEGSAWQPEEATLVEKLVRQIQADYTIDPARVVVFGRDSGATLAYILAFRNRELFRAAAVVDAAPMLPPPENDPEQRLALYVFTAKNSRQVKLIDAVLKRLAGLKVPVTRKDLGLEPRELADEDLAELARWFDMLDRI